MVYPCLVLKQFCTTPISLTIEQEGLNEYGEPLETIEYKGLCNYQDKVKTVFTSDKKLVEIKGVALFPGDICPKLPSISGGEGTVFGQSRRIEEGQKHRNPDGTVNYTEVWLV